MNEKIIAAIVIFRPDTERLFRNIDAALEQIKKVVLVINDEKFDSSEFRNKYKNRIAIIDNKVNKGIAYALNEAMYYAKKKGYEWVLTLDQDTIIPSGLIEEFSIFTRYEKIGIIAPEFIDQGFYREDEEKSGWRYCLSCITSGSLTNVEIWDHVGGFDSKLFIDFVDLDYCAKLIRNGYGIIKDSDIKIQHKIGSSKRKFIGKYSVRVSNHSPMRRYYMYRNGVYMISKYPELYSTFLNKWYFFVFGPVAILLFEDQKVKKLTSIVKGILDAGKLVREEKRKQKDEKDRIRKLVKRKYQDEKG